MQITDKDLQQFRERAKTELQSNGAVGRLAWDSVVDSLCNEVEELRENAATGNAAAMREALVEVEGAIFEDEPGRFWLADAEVILHRVQAALATPARNCDRFQTADEAVAAFADHLRAWENAHGIHSEYPDHPVQVPAGAFAWLFAMAEGGAK